MKKIFILFILIFSATLGYSQDKWYPNTKGTMPNSLSSIFFISENEGWIGGYNGYLIHTTNGGTTWETQTVPVTTQLRDIFFLDNQNGWMVTDAATLLKTTNGGKNWTSTKVSAIDATANITQILFLDSQLGFLVTSKSSTGIIAKTTDGGATWTITSPSTALLFYEVNFTSKTNGIAGGKDWNSNYWTTDGGSTWTKQSPCDISTVPPVCTYSRTDIKTVYMVNATIGYGSGWGFTAQGIQPTIYLKTTDGGKNWKYLAQKEENWTSDYNNKLYFTDENTGYAFGGNSSQFGGWIAKTTNGGVDWVPQPTLSAVEYLDVAIVGATIYFISGSGSNIMKSTDMGKTIQFLTINSGSHNTIQFPTTNVGYCTGPTNPTFLKTTDGGKNWKTMNLVFPKTSFGSKTRAASQLFFLDENYGYAANKYRLITKTTDGGNTWVGLTRDTGLPGTGTANFHFNGLHFVDKNTGWVVGRSGGVTPGFNYTIYKTTDGGANWDIKTGTNELLAVSFSSATTGIAVGKKANILYTTDGGTNWNKGTVPAIKDSTIADVKFVGTNSPIAFAVAGKGTLIITTDGGKTWIEHPTSSTQFSGLTFNQIAIKDLTTAVIAGYFKPTTTIRGSLIGTSNGGLTLTDFTDTTVFENNLTGVTCDPAGNFWAVTPSGGIIYSTKNTTGIKDNNGAPRGYSLSQNYPNPFNPSTTIAFSIPRSGNVKLAIYDILGKEVKVYNNTYPESGKYSVIWDGKNNRGQMVSSGVYYYKIEANKFSNVKKMMYIR